MRTRSTDTPARRRDTAWRRAAGCGLLTLLPTALLSWLLVLSSTRFARCLTYGEGCESGAGTCAWYAFWAALAAGVAALALPSARRWTPHVRAVMVCGQLAAQAVMATAILAQA